MKQNRFIFIFLAVCLLIGIFTLDSYGESWDDLSLQKYADYSLRTYGTWRAQGVMPITDKDLGNYGPAYMMTVMLGSRALSFLPLNPSDIRHLFYFLTHLIGVWAFYELGKRWLGANAAFYATLLYATQPLFWGHSFMNPKDTPFLAFFMLSLLFGFKMIDSVERIETPVSNLPLKTRVLTTLGIIAVFSLFASPEFFRAAIESLVRAASSGETNIISLIASDLHKVNPEVYIQRYFVFFLWIRAAFFLLFLLIAIYQLPRPVRYYLPAILFPAFLLGYTTSIRVIAPFAGMIVALYAFRKLGKRAVFPLLIYALFAIISTYNTWPYLWSNPIGHFIEAIQTMSKYPWFGKVLFNGAEYAPTELPYSYLPVLLAIQLTTPVWILFFIGLFSLGNASRHDVKPFPNSEKSPRQNHPDQQGATHAPHNRLLALTVIWFVLPLIGFIVARAALYDNFRQIFFILPPIFFVAGLGMETILKRATKPALRVLIASLLILPGIAAGIRLHPYEYVYYNSLIQNPNGKFELDYWAISYREAAEYINAVAPPNSNIMVVGPGQTVDLYVRDDLTVLSDDEPTDEPFDYVIVTTRYNFDRETYPDAKVVYKIERDGMLLTVVKKISK
ncbi:MAG: glycosyltransferase family 39 protein [Anaerolineales bacterium]|nr:glycosyltransferase family 39 protein [Anaerolineales bacterium]